MNKLIENTLLEAVQNGKEKEVKMRLSLFKEDTSYNINAVNSQGQTILHLACLHAPQLLQIFFPKDKKNPYGININCKDEQNKTALCYVCEIKNIDILNILAEHDDALDLIDGFKIAIEKDDKDVIFRLLEIDKENTIINHNHDAWILKLAEKNAIQAIEMLLLLDGFIDFNQLLGTQLVSLALKRASKELMSLYVLFGALSGKILSRELASFLKTMRLDSCYVLTTINPLIGADCYGSYQVIMTGNDLQYAQEALQIIAKGEFFSYVAYKKLLSSITFDWSDRLRDPKLNPKAMITLYYKLSALKLDSPIEAMPEIFSFIKESNLEAIFIIPHKKLMADFIQLSELVGDRYANRGIISKLNLLTPQSLVSTIHYQMQRNSQDDVTLGLIRASKSTEQVLLKAQIQLNDYYEALKKPAINRAFYTGLFLIPTFALPVLSIIALVMLAASMDESKDHTKGNHSGSKNVQSGAQVASLIGSILLTSFSITITIVCFLPICSSNMKTRTLLYRARPNYFLSQDLHSGYENIKKYIQIILQALQENHPARQEIKNVLGSIKNYHSVSHLLNGIEKLNTILTALVQDIAAYNKKHMQPPVSTKGKEKVVTEQELPALLLPANLCSIDLNLATDTQRLTQLVQQPPLLESFKYKKQPSMEQTRIIVSEAMDINEYTPLLQQKPR